MRRFAGWSASGERLAYVLSDKLPFADEATWAFLLVPDPFARDAVYLAGGTGDGPGRPAFSGMRVTFPQWAPHEEKLSVWFTFTPAYQSVLSQALGSWLATQLGLTLRRGDPAAVLDVESGKIGWMAVNAREKVQVGHYYLLKHNYAEAWRWYEDAERQPAPPAPPTPPGMLDYLRRLAAPDDYAFFQYHCLIKLGRKEEAQARLEQFRRSFARELPTAEQEPLLGVQINGRSVRQALQDLLDPKQLSGSLLRDLYAAEVFLSVDAAEDGEAFFRQALASADTDTARLSSAVVLAQFLLLEKKYPAYADLATDVIAPLLAKLHRPDVDREKDWLAPEALQELVILAAGAPTLTPLLVPDFLAKLPDDQVRALISRWNALQAAAHDNTGRQAIDLFLHAAYQRLGMEKERQAIAERFVKQHGGTPDLLDGKHLTEMIDEARRQMQTTILPR